MPASVGYDDVPAVTMELEARSRLLLRVQYLAWASPPGARERVVEPARRKAWEPFEVCETNTLVVACSVPAADAERRALQWRAAEIAGAFMPDGFADNVRLDGPLASAPAIETFSSGPVEESVFSWCEAAPDRFVFARLDSTHDKDGAPVGTRLRRR